MVDVFVIGAGLFGATMARLCKDRGYNVIVIEKESKPGGMAFDDNYGGINVHVNGAHIFHTNDESIWSFVTKFDHFNTYHHKVLANYNNRIFTLPFCMLTFEELWGIKDPDQAKARIDLEIQRANIKKITNLREQAISLVGTTIYEKFIEGYSEKQWGRSCEELDPSIIKRIPIRYNFDNLYFSDRYQGIPIHGYQYLVNNMLKGIPVTYDSTLNRINDLAGLSSVIVFTGSVDELFHYEYGTLEYRTLRFEHEMLDIPSYQSNSVINFTSKSVPFTRIIEHKKFVNTENDCTIITKEYSDSWDCSKPRYYPIIDERNQKLYERYAELAKSNRVVLGGRLGEYRYYDMDKTIASAFEKFKEVEKLIDEQSK